MFRRGIAALTAVLTMCSGAEVLAEDQSADMGITNVASKHAVGPSLDRLESILKAKGMTVFARIEHSAEAAKVGLSMRPTALLIFGNPRAGTPLMIASPSMALDLPLKVLAWEDEKGQVWLSYNSPTYLQRRHGLKEELLKNIAGISSLVQQAASP
jgi:uncharacterized protein (DUF302 family)